MYDVSSKLSFTKLDDWLNELETYATKHEIVKMLVGNKIDKVCDVHLLYSHLFSLLFHPLWANLGGWLPCWRLGGDWFQFNRGGWLSFLLFFHPSTPCGPTVGIERRDSSLLHPVDGCEGGRTQVCYTL